MNSIQATVLVVDDEPLQLELHTAFLEAAGYQTLRATNGQQALTLLQKDPAAIDVILSDVAMPEMDGYAFCEQVRAHEETKNTPFIFVSALTNLEEKLKGYDAGGNDYVTKPIEAEEMLEKIKHVIDCREKLASQEQQLAESFNAAMQAMTYSSDLGQILEFYKNSLNAHSFEELAGYLFQTMAAYGLRCTLHIETLNGPIDIGDSGPVPPLEKNVIELARQKTRFYDFGVRTIINYEDFSLLVKNMPVDDAERYGTFKDTLGTLCNAIEARVKVLLSDDANRQKAQVLETVRQALGKIGDSFGNIQKANLQAIEGMVDDLDNAIMNLGLTDNQENQIRDIAVKCYEQVDKIFDEGLTLNNEVEILDKRLTEIFADIDQ
ncbi:MAG TPA: response regulator [Gammaproteobacteria bacterium]|nr:response regulator [Gammaproteobacteria bacterium]